MRHPLIFGAFMMISCSLASRDEDIPSASTTQPILMPASAEELVGDGATLRAVASIDDSILAAEPGIDARSSPQGPALPGDRDVTTHHPRGPEELAVDVLRTLPSYSLRGPCSKPEPKGYSCVRYAIAQYWPAVLAAKREAWSADADLSKFYEWLKSIPVTKKRPFFPVMLTTKDAVPKSLDEVRRDPKYEDRVYLTLDLVNEALAMHERAQQVKGAAASGESRYRCWVVKRLELSDGTDVATYKLECPNTVNLPREPARPDAFFSLAKGAYDAKGERVYHVTADAYRSTQSIEGDIRQKEPDLVQVGPGRQQIYTGFDRTLRTFLHKDLWNKYSATLLDLWKRSAFRTQYALARRRAWDGQASRETALTYAYLCRTSFDVGDPLLAWKRLLYRLVETRKAVRSQAQPPALGLTGRFMNEASEHAYIIALAKQAADWSSLRGLPVSVADIANQLYTTSVGTADLKTDLRWRRGCDADFLDHLAAIAGALTPDDVGCTGANGGLFWEEIDWDQAMQDEEQKRRR